MSYDLSLIDPVTKETLQLSSPHDLRGGTYAVGGTTECSLNVTYNYSVHWQKAFGEGKHLRNLYGLSGAESIPILKAAIENLGNDVDPNYWEATEGNVKNCLHQLLALAQLRPDGIWDGD